MGATTKYGLPYPDPGDPANVPQDMADLANGLDDLIATADQGTLAARPTSTSGSPGKEGRLYYATDVKLLFYDTGTSWHSLGGPNRGYGLLGYAEKTSSQTFTEAAGEADVTGLSVSGVVVAAGRRIEIKVRAKVELVNGTAGILGFDGITKRGSTAIGSWGYQDGLETDPSTCPMWYEGSVIESPAAGTYTYKASFLPFYQDHRVIANAGTTKAYIKVEDIGPAVLL